MYGILITLAIIVSLLFSEKLVEKKGLNKDIYWQAAFWAILFGIIGARLYHVIDFWEIYSQNPLHIVAIWNGGLGIFGALLGGGVAFMAVLKSNKQNLLNWLDILVIPLPLAQAIGRLGNYFNNELLPYALYEITANFGLFLLLLRLKKRENRQGIMFVVYLAGYSVIRLFLEPLREDSWTIAGLNVAQTISILLLLVSVSLFTKWKLKPKKSS